jgi:hypothetical protein
MDLKYLKYKNKYLQLKQSAGAKKMIKKINNPIFIFKNEAELIKYDEDTRIRYLENETLQSLSELKIVDNIQFKYFYKIFNDVRFKMVKTVHDNYRSIFNIQIDLDNNEFRIQLGDISKQKYRITKTFKLKLILENFRYDNNNNTKTLSYSQDGNFDDGVNIREPFRYDTFYNDENFIDITLDRLIYNFDNNILNYTSRQISDILNFLWHKRIFESFTELDDFYLGCIKIAYHINKINYIEPHNIIIPGDSPYKIYLLLKKNNLCPNCRFFQFPISGLMENLEIYGNLITYYRNRRDSLDNIWISEKSNEIYEYCSKFFPTDNIENTTIIDYTNTGTSFLILPNTFDYMLFHGKIEDNSINHRSIKYMIYHLVDSLKEIRLGPYKSEYPYTQDSKYYLSINDYFDSDLLNKLANADTQDRCVPSNNTYEVIDSTRFNNIRCKLYVYAAMLKSLI